MSLSSPQSPAHIHHRPTWWMLLLSSIALAGLFFQKPDKYPSIQTPLLMIALGLAYILPWRLPGRGVIPWIVRGTILFVMILVAPEGHGFGRFWFSDPNVMHLLGTMLASELVIQHYLPYTGTMRLGQMLLAACGIMATATSTFESRFITVLAPLFALAIMGVLGHFRPVQATSPATTVLSPKRTSRRWLVNGVAIALAITIGFLGIGTMRAYKRALNNLMGKMIANIARGNPSTGMSDKEILGVRYNLTSNPERMLKIRGTSRAMHLRGLAFDLYEGSQWLPNLSKRPRGPMPPELGLPEATPAVRVERLADRMDLLYIPLNTTGVRVETPALMEVETGHRATVQATPDKVDTLVYDFGLPHDDRTQGQLCRPLTDEERLHCLHVPGNIDPRLVELARSLKRDDDLHTVFAIIKNLQDNHGYSLDCRPGPGEPISDFVLTAGKKAHCQYFASAATMMLRCNGIPARYVTGYFAHESTSDNSMVVRACDAHAWCEAWLGGVGWFTVEATPASGTPPGQAKEHPISLLRKLREALTDFFSSAGEFFRALQWYHIAIAGASLTLVAVTIQIVRARREKRRMPAMRSYDFPSEQYQQLAMEFERLLRQITDIPSGAATWSEHLSDQRRQVSPHRHIRQSRIDAARRFVDAYNRIRFGKSNDPAAFAELHRLLDDARR